VRAHTKVESSPEKELEARYRKRASQRWADRLRRLVEPPLPLILNPAEPKDFPLGRWNLYIGGAGRQAPGYVNLDIVATPGVTVAGDVEALPFPSGIFTRVECDAVLEHVRDPVAAMREIVRVTEPGGYIHLVTPFCHPFHEYPKDYRRFTIDGLKELAAPLEVVAQGWRTGPAATLLVTGIEFVKLLVPSRAWRAMAHVALGWALFPLRYLDLWLLRVPEAGRIGNHCYVWLRKPGVDNR
jgi:SAM-dependent methyltransferase